MTVDAGPQLIDGDHVVQLYADDDELVTMVSGYLAGALAAGDAVVVVATAAHRKAFEAALDRSQVAIAKREDRLVMLDAGDTLARFMTEGGPDPQAFDDVVGQLVRSASARGRPVRAYGEMVALLWADGLTESALELEELWNDLGEGTPFALFCAYPAHGVGDPVASGEGSRICNLHTGVLSSAPSLTSSEATRRFPRTPDSAAQARRFVRETLTSWGHHSVMEAALLAVSELASNAITHAASDFTVGLSRVLRGVHLEVTDSSDVPPQQRNARRTAVGGRGLVLVQAIGRRWGHHLLPGGKVVWVELAHTDLA